MKIQRTVETTATPDAVFDYLSDFATTEEWDPGTVSTTRVSGDGGVGTVYHNVSQFMGRKTELDYTVIEHSPPGKFVLRGENKTLTAIDTMDITGVGAKTQVTYTADFTFKNKIVGLVLSPLLAPAFKKLGDDAEKGLAEALAKL